jgi:hypothetical protein
MSISENAHKNDFDMMTMTPKWSRETGTELPLICESSKEGSCTE